MTRQVYQGLDRPTDFFDIRGRYLVVLLLGVMMSIIFAIIVGKLTDLTFGILFFVFLCFIWYLVVRSIQYRISERELLRLVVRQGYPTIIRMRTCHIRNIWNGWNLPNNLIS